MAGPGRRAHHRAFPVCCDNVAANQTRGGRAHHLGSRDSRQERGDHRRYLPQRPDAHRQKDGEGRTNSRACRRAPNREHHTSRHSLGSYEDGHPRPHRQAQRGLLEDAPAGRRAARLSFLIFPRFYRKERRCCISQYPTPTALLGMLHQSWRSRDAALWIGRLAPLQRTDTVHRTALLSIDRNETCDVPRPRTASALPGTRRQRNQRDVPQRLLVIATNGRTDSCTPINSRIRACQGLSPWLCNRIRFLRPHPVETHVGIEEN